MPLTSLSVWIPVAIAIGSIILTVALGVVYQTHHLDKRIDDLGVRLDRRISDQEKHSDKRLEDLEKRLVDRIERLEHPIETGR